MIRFVLGLTVCLLLAANCQAAEFNWKLHKFDQKTIGGRWEGILLPDTDYIFNLEGLPCEVGMVKVFKLKKGKVIEIRKIKCYPQKDIMVSTIVQCSSDADEKRESGQLVVKIENKSYIPMLSCYEKIDDNEEEYQMHAKEE